LALNLPNHGDLNWDVLINQDLTTLDTNQTSHAGNTGNPHAVTAGQVGAVKGAVALTVAAAAPSAPASNDLWFNTTTKLWNFYNGTAFTAQSQTPVGGGTPTNVVAGTGSADGTSSVAAREDHVHGNAALPSRPALYGFSMPGPAAVRVAAAVILAPLASTVTAFQARIGAGSGVTVQLVLNGTAVGPVSAVLAQTTVNTVVTPAINLVAGDQLGLQILNAGTGASDLSVMCTAAFTG
jgi:hypothetical protein